MVFGKVVDGMLTLRKIEAVPTGANNKPKLSVKITGKVQPQLMLQFLTNNSLAECGEM